MVRGSTILEIRQLGIVIGEADFGVVLFFAGCWSGNLTKKSAPQTNRHAISDHSGHTRRDYYI